MTVINQDRVEDGQIRLIGNVALFTLGKEDIPGLKIYQFGREGKREGARGSKREREPKA
jgi:hypothetical protein